MKNYVISARVTAFLSIVSFSIIIYLHYFKSGEEIDFWCNVCLAIFGSALLTLITSIVGYYNEKRNTLENFAYSTRSLLHFINKYDVNWKLEKKIDFYIDYADIDKSLWDSQLGMIYFWWNFKFKDDYFNYIYNSIYKPIQDFNKATSEHEFHFRWHKDGTGKNDAVMTEFVSELEQLFIENISEELLLEDGEKVRNTLIKNKGSINFLVVL